MNLLIDTHALLWFLLDDFQLGESRADIINAQSNTVYISAASGFEISNKVRVGKLPEALIYITNLEQVCIQHSFKILPLNFEHCKLAGMIQSPHRDPFDRMLAAQSIIEDMPIMTIDVRIKELGAEVIW